jgi:hypothetical protein
MVPFAKPCEVDHSRRVDHRRFVRRRKGHIQMTAIHRNPAYWKPPTKSQPRTGNIASRFAISAPCGVLKINRLTPTHTEPAAPNA